jgi:hypothetical protein
LDHEFVNNAMKFTSSVGGRMWVLLLLLATRGSFLARYEGDEIITRLWDLFVE